MKVEMGGFWVLGPARLRVPMQGALLRDCPGAPGPAAGGHWEPAPGRPARQAVPRRGGMLDAGNELPT